MLLYCVIVHLEEKRFVPYYGFVDFVFYNVQASSSQGAEDKALLHAEKEYKVIAEKAEAQLLPIQDIEACKLAGDKILS